MCAWFLQATQKCICDTEHMFDCPEENAHRGEEDIAAVVRKCPFLRNGIFHQLCVYFRTFWLASLGSTYQPVKTPTWKGTNCPWLLKRACFEQVTTIQSYQKSLVEQDYYYHHQCFSKLKLQPSYFKILPKIFHQQKRTKLRLLLFLLLSFCHRQF